tara:strand:- start:1807 stop:2799 length:993 start_codon:yes stop_codon:yes gene_type:complete
MSLITELLDPFERMLDDISPPSVVRAIERGGDTDALWQAIEESGFLDALVNEENGGAGLSFSDIGTFAQLLGRKLAPVPIMQTMAARALLTNSDITVPEGPILLISPFKQEQGYYAAAIPLATKASHALVDCGDRLVLTELTQAQTTPNAIHASESADLRWSDAPPGPTLPRPADGLRSIAATLRAAEIAGACDRLLTMTVSYAGERVQFGKPIGKLQAVQQQLAVMAEQVAMACMAAEMGCASGFPAPLFAAATAKQVTSSAAAQVAAIAHAVHGAIGFSEELDLQLYTRRLYEWRIADGSESYWAAIIGRQRLADGNTVSIDFIRAQC